MAQLNFNNYTTRRQQTRSPLSGFIQSKLRGIIEHSEPGNGSRPPEAFYPFKYLPVMAVDDTTEDGIVIAKGTVVAGMTTKITPYGFGEVADASSIFVGVDYTGGAITANIDLDFWGYSDGIAALLIPANGGYTVISGSGSMDEYTILDTGRTIQFDGSLVNIVAGGSNVDLPYNRVGNYPIGLVTADVYQDIRGANLNYQLFNISGIVSRGYIELPFVDLYNADAAGLAKHNALAVALENGSTSSEIAPLTTTGSSDWYMTVGRIHAFAYNPSGTANLLIPGSLLMSDNYGKLVPQWAAPSPTSADAATAFPLGALGTSAAPDGALITAQTVGRLVVTDSRFPKADLETVTTYPGSMMPGTETAGLPSPLFTFVRDVMIQSAFNTAPSRKNILDSVQRGTFGVARIQLLLA